MLFFLNFLSLWGLGTTYLLAILFAILASGHANLNDGLLYNDDIKKFLANKKNHKLPEFEHMIIDLAKLRDPDLLKIFQLMYIYGYKHQEIMDQVFITSTKLDYKKREIWTACLVSLNNYHKFVTFKIKR